MAELVTIAKVISSVGTAVSGIQSLRDRGPKAEPVAPTVLTDPDQARRQTEERKRAATAAAAQKNSNVLTSPSGLSSGSAGGNQAPRTALGR